MKNFLSRVRRGFQCFKNRYFSWGYKLSKIDNHVEIGVPVNVNPAFVKMENFTRIHPDVKLISAGYTVTIKKYSAISAGCLIIPGTHTPTVGVPQFLSILHVNDTGSGIVIDEDCWIGAESALLHRCHIGRGCVVGARSVVTKEIPPYAVVAGTPARIVATRFTLEQILEHERILYPPEERLPMDKLRELFDGPYKGLKSLGTDEISESDLQTVKQKMTALGIMSYQ